MPVAETRLAHGFDDRIVAAAAMMMGNARLNLQALDSESEVRQVLDQARRQLGVPETDWSAKSLERIRGKLSEEITRRLTEGYDVEEIGTRLGAAGTLPLGGYKISPSKAFRNDFKGESVSFAETIIRNADAYEHLLQPRDEPSNNQWSIFAKRVSSLKRDKTYWAIVTAYRRDDNLSINTLWRLFLPNVDQHKTSSPIDLLKLFVDEYGVPFLIAGVENKGLVLKRSIPFKKSNGPDDEADITFGQPEGSKADVLFRWIGATIEVRIGYCIDLKRYNRDRARFA